MSASSVKAAVERDQRELESLQSELSKLSEREAAKSAERYRAQEAIERSPRSYIAQSKRQMIVRLDKELADIQKKRAEVAKKVSAATKRKHQHERDLEKLREREQRAAFDRIARESKRVVTEGLRRAAATPLSELDIPESAHDAFIAHASEDKESVVRPLAEGLRTAGFNVWYDEFTLKVGDSLRRSIDRGLASSRYGIVILSPNFFAKEWPQRELDGLVAKEIAGAKVVLPIWHNISKDEVMRHSPTLADKLALTTAQFRVDELVEKLAEVLRT